MGERSRSRVSANCTAGLEGEADAGRQRWTLLAAQEALAV
jgi:hypothetical protein